MATRNLDADSMPNVHHGFFAIGTDRCNMDYIHDLSVEVQRIVAAPYNVSLQVGT